ncbi:hypothetical protein ASF25_21180 [Methylobacterium sp. Leaf100]|nr:hypothetical protein ASF25_21180 [Methylobacterium sp. Leaf100]
MQQRASDAAHRAALVVLMVRLVMRVRLRAKGYREPNVGFWPGTPASAGQGAHLGRTLVWIGAET